MSDVTHLQGGEYAHMLAAVRHAASGGINTLSSGEALAAALVLNRPDWIAAMSFTIAEALERIGPEWARLVPAVSKQFVQERDEEAYAAAERARLAKESAFIATVAGDGEVELQATYVSHGDAPGYRDVDLIVDLEPLREGAQFKQRVDTKSSADALEAIRQTHELAWSSPEGPIDIKPGEKRPRWL